MSRVAVASIINNLRVQIPLTVAHQDFINQSQDRQRDRSEWIEAEESCPAGFSGADTQAYSGGDEEIAMDLPWTNAFMIRIQHRRSVTLVTCRRSQFP